jgi:hypothetical protein
MPSQSVSTTRRGQFRDIYRRLRRKNLLASVPIIFCEGDSWFSYPLSMNLLDWIVYPTPEDEARGVPVSGAGGLFFRAEQSGDTAAEIFAQRNIRDLVDWYEGFEFDLVLLSAGGNDFVGDFLQRLFARKKAMTVPQALQAVVDSGRFESVAGGYRRFIAAFRKVRPDVPLLAHTYDYPQLLGRPADLTLANIGAVALLKNDVGPWIAPYIEHVLPRPGDQLGFTRGLIDEFEARVLRPLKKDTAPGGAFDYVDLRGTLTKEQWYDEMHPTGAGFHALSAKFASAIRGKLPAEKRRG